MPRRSATNAAVCCGANRRRGAGNAACGCVRAVEKNASLLALRGVDQRGRAEQHRVAVLLDHAGGQASDDGGGGLDAVGHAFKAQAMLAWRQQDAARFGDQGEAAKIVEIKPTLIAIGIAIDGDRYVDRRACEHVLRLGHERCTRAGEAGNDEPTEAGGPHELRLSRRC